MTNLIVGAGPTGLGAAHRLMELGQDDFLVLEAHDYPGGLGASFIDRAGFTWDVGGHVVFSHYPYFDALLDEILAGEFLEHQREAWIRLGGTWTPYPFQNNIRHLPKDMVWECVRGLLPEFRQCGENFTPANFREWIHYIFGEGMAKLFMLPYNFKVWATPPERMAYHWVGERVSVVGLERVLKNLILGVDDVSWGPNNVFKFPLRGGTGEIFRRMAAKLGDRILYGHEVTAVDPQAKQVRCANGQSFSYNHLLFTGPLDRLAKDLLTQAPDAVRQAASGLEHNGAHIGGIGVEGMRPDSKCWMYFPEDNCPFYRVTNFHNYSPFNTPDPQDMRPRQRAFMTEVSFSAHKPGLGQAHLDRAVDGLVATTLLSPEDRQKIASTWEMTIDYAYPIPSLGRDQALGVIQPWLKSQGIYGRGRFGGFKYEVGNMDHSVMQGVEWAEALTLGTPEKTYIIKD